MNRDIAALVPNTDVVKILWESLNREKAYLAFKAFKYNPTPENRQKAEEYLHICRQIMCEVLGGYRPVDSDSRKMFRFESVMEVFEHFFDKNIFPGKKGNKIMLAAFNKQLDSSSDQKELVKRYYEDVQERNSREISLHAEAKAVSAYLLGTFRVK